jgi:hypothetical protein
MHHTDRLAGMLSSANGPAWGLSLAAALRLVDSDGTHALLLSAHALHTATMQPSAHTLLVRLLPPPLSAQQLEEEMASTLGHYSIPTSAVAAVVAPPDMLLSRALAAQGLRTVSCAAEMLEEVVGEAVGRCGAVLDLLARFGGPAGPRMLRRLEAVGRLVQEKQAVLQPHDVTLLSQVRPGGGALRC